MVLDCERGSKLIPRVAKVFRQAEVEVVAVEAEVVEEIVGTSVIAVRIMGILGVSLYKISPRTACSPDMSSAAPYSSDRSGRRSSDAGTITSTAGANKAVSNSRWLAHSLAYDSIDIAIRSSR